MMTDETLPILLTPGQVHAVAHLLFEEIMAATPLTYGPNGVTNGVRCEQCGHTAGVEGAEHMQNLVHDPTCMVGAWAASYPKFVTALAQSSHPGSLIS